MNLEKVYAIIALEENTIKVSVFARQTNETHCLAYEEAHVDFDIDFSAAKNINYKEIKNVLKDLLFKIDVFTKMPIDQYILVASSLHLRKKDNCQSKKYQAKNFDILLQDIRLDLFSHQTSTYKTIFIDLKTWLVNGNKKVDQLDFNTEQYDSIEFVYDEIKCSGEILRVINKLFSELNLDLLLILDHDLILETLSINNGKTYFDINRASTRVHAFKKKYELNVGYNSIIQDFKALFQIDNETQITDLINLYKIVKNETNSIPICNIYPGSYLEVTIINQNLFKNNILNQFTNNYLAKIQGAINSKINDVCNPVIVARDESYNFFKSQNVNCTLLEAAPIAFLQNYNIGIIQQAFNFYLQHQLIKNSNRQYSITKNIDNYIEHNQINKELVLNFGIISTKLASKGGN